jgi:spore maturation protein CgeB
MAPLGVLPESPPMRACPDAPTQPRPNSFRMRLVVFGLSVSSSWGNGHATLWRGLIRALGSSGHDVTFFEWDVPYHARHRDAVELPGCKLELYLRWEGVVPRAQAALRDSDVAIVTSYCPDGVQAARLVLDSRAPRRVFYDLDTPVTLERLDRGEEVGYLPPEGLGGFDLVLSSTGGAALTALTERLGARRVAPLYGSVEPAALKPAPATEAFRCDLSYLAAFTEDRRRGFEELLLQPAMRAPHRKFLVAGPLYPADRRWPDNVAFREHVPPPEHAAFFGSSMLTLHLTRGQVARLGYCPSGRLFEAAACGVPVLSDAWEGLEQFFVPGEEILVAHKPEDTLAALERPREELAAVGRAARARVLSAHTAERRAAELLALID